MLILREFVRNIQIDEEELLATLRREIEERGLQSELDGGESEAPEQNLEKDLKEIKIKNPELFEVPEFLYKFSSTFFKKASGIERKTEKLFGKPSTENLRIRTDRITQAALNVFNKDQDSEKPREFHSEIRPRRF